MAVYDGPFLCKEDRSLAHNGGTQYFRENAIQLRYELETNDLVSFWQNSGERIG